MESGKTTEGEGSPGTANQSEGETPARDSENDTQCKEDTLKQVLTCGTGNSGPEASAPLGDNGTTAGQGSEDASPASPDKPQDDISSSQLESCDQGTGITTLESRTDIGFASNDESEEWETASEQSDTYVEIDDASTDKHGNLESGRKTDIGGSCRQHKDTGNHESCQLTEVTEQNSKKDKLQKEQVSTPNTQHHDEEETAIKVYRTAREETRTHTTLGKESKIWTDHISHEKTLPILPVEVTVSEKSTFQENKHVSQEIGPPVEEADKEMSIPPQVDTLVPFVDSTGPPIQGTDSERSMPQEETLVPDNIVPLVDSDRPHIEETGSKTFTHQEDQLVSEETKPYITNTLLYEESNNKEFGPQGDEKTIVEETTRAYEKTSGGTTYSPTQRTAPEMEKANVECMVPTLYELVCEEAGAQVEDTVREQSLYHEKEKKLDWAMFQNFEEIGSDLSMSKMFELCKERLGYQDEELVGDGALLEGDGMSQCKEPCEITGPLISVLASEEAKHYVEETVSEKLRHHMTVSNGTGHHKEEASGAEAILDEKNVLNEETSDEAETATTVTPIKDATSEEIAPYIEVTECILQTIEAEIGQDYRSLLDENGNPDVLFDYRQGLLAASKPENLVDGSEITSNNEQLFCSQLVPNKGSNVDHGEINKNEIESNISESVMKCIESFEKETSSHLLDRYSEEQNDVVKESLTQETCNDHEPCIEIDPVNNQTVGESKMDNHEEMDGQTTIVQDSAPDIEDKIRDHAECQIKETGDENVDLLNVESHAPKVTAAEKTSTEYAESIIKEHGEHKDSHDKETFADSEEIGHNKECISVKHQDNFGEHIIFFKDTSALDHVDNQIEEISAIIVNISDTDRDIQAMDNIFIGGSITETSREERELPKQRATQDQEIVSIKELLEDKFETHQNIPTFEEETDKPNEDKTVGIFYAKESGEEEIETARLEDQICEIKELEAKVNNMEAKEKVSEDILEVQNHQRLFEDDTDKALDVNKITDAETRDPMFDNVLNVDSEMDKPVIFDSTETINTSFLYTEPFRLIDFSYDSSKILDNKLEEPNNNEVQLVGEGSSFDDPSYKLTMDSAVLKPMHMEATGFSYNFSKILGIDDTLKDKNYVHGPESGQCLKESSYKDLTDTTSIEQSFEIKDSLNLSFQNQTIEHVQGVKESAGQRSELSDFSADPEQLVQDEPDYFNQALILDQEFKSESILTRLESFSKPETSKPTLLTFSRLPEAGDQMLTILSGPTEINKPILTTSNEPTLTETLSHDMTVVDQEKDMEVLQKEICQNTDDNWEINTTKPYQRQRSNTDPCIIYGQGGEKHITQEADQHIALTPRARLRSITPPLDNFTQSFTTKTYQALQESKPLKPAQTSILHSIPDDNIRKEGAVGDIAPKKEYNFFPMQIFNPLLLVTESTEEPGFYQAGKPNKARYPSPPREDQVFEKVQQSPSRDGTSDSAQTSSEEASSSRLPTIHTVSPKWLPPRPLDVRHLKSNENPLIRRATIRQKKNTKRFGAANLPAIPQQGYLNETGTHYSENSPRAPVAKGQSSSASRPLPRQQKIHEQDVDQLKKSPKDILAEAEERHEKKKLSESPEAVMRRGRQTPAHPPTSESTRSIHRRYSTLINSSSLLYQEYSDVALNQEIQRQKPGDSPAEEKDPGSPRLRRRLLSSQDSYLQRLSISSADSLWQDLPKIRDSVTFMSMTRDEQKLQEAKFELIMSEVLYLRSLNIAVDHFLRSTALQEIVSPQDRQWLFSRLSEVRDASNDFLFDLEEEFENNMYNFQVCDVVINHEPNFRKVYLPYVTNQTYQDRTFQRLMNGNPRFQQVLAKLESDPVCQRLSLKSFLILPFQRITRLRLLLQNILKRSAPGSTEELQATEAHNGIEKLIRDCNESVQKMKDTEELILLSQKIQFECKIFPLISASRRLIKHGEVTSLEYNSVSFKWKVTTRPVYIHLFNDCLLLSRVREGGRFVVFDHASEFRVERCEIKLHSNQKNIFRVFLRDSAAALGREGHPENQETQYMFRTETQSQKLRWICALSQRKEEIDFLRDHGLQQVQCYKSYKGRENDELSLEKADILMVLQNSDDGWLCGIRLSDQQSGWFPLCHVQPISRNACLRNLQEEQRLQTARAKLQPTAPK